MRRTGTHTHKCSFAAAGCKGTLECSDDYLERNHDPDGVYCSVNPMNEIECEDCNLSRCSECGHVLNIDTHDDDCPKATQV